MHEHAETSSPCPHNQDLTGAHMITQDQVRDVIGQPVLSGDGDKLGKAGQVFLDDETNKPEWVTVNTRLFGSKESFVPLAEASASSEGITVPYTKDQIKNAPAVDIET